MNPGSGFFRGTAHQRLFGAIDFSTLIWSIDECVGDLSPTEYDAGKRGPCTTPCDFRKSRVSENVRLATNVDQLIAPTWLRLIVLRTPYRIIFGESTEEIGTLLKQRCKLRVLLRWPDGRIGMSQSLMHVFCDLFSINQQKLATLSGDALSLLPKGSPLEDRRSPTNQHGQELAGFR